MRARARAGYGARRWARGRPGRASAERFAASQRRTGLEGFEWTEGQRNAMKNERAPARVRKSRTLGFAARGRLPLMVVWAVFMTCLHPATPSFILAWAMIVRLLPHQCHRSMAQSLTHSLAASVLHPRHVAWHG